MFDKGQKADAGIACKGMHCVIRPNAYTHKLPILSAYTCFLSYQLYIKHKNTYFVAQPRQRAPSLPAQV
ncbi:hypothetical protein SAMN05444128_2220 [Pontibacter indicus]|uniref:Uncharacterized protein n=1 Tax=Pontibacter indicus TaxID=1317125 RepID=A0A1R3XFE9_9BACT|nr:hypothetical protein SAMN05444128_2220 [Pontibacter indicus]